MLKSFIAACAVSLLPLYALGEPLQAHVTWEDRYNQMAQPGFWISVFEADADNHGKLRNKRLVRSSGSVDIDKAFEAELNQHYMLPRWYGHHIYFIAAYNPIELSDWYLFMSK